MSDLESMLAGRAEDLRRAFDRSFAEPVRADMRETVDFISVRLAGDLHAVRMSAVGGLFGDIKVTPCPSPMPELRGIAGFRGTLTPVYDLAQLLGYPRSAGRWMVLTAARTLALAFNEFDGHFRVEPADIAGSHTGEAGKFVREVAHHDDLTQPIIDIAAILESIAGRISKTSPSKE